MIYELRGYGVASALKISVYQEFAISLIYAIVAKS